MAWKSPYPTKDLEVNDRIQVGEFPIKGTIVSAVKIPFGKKTRKVYRVLWDGSKHVDSSPFLDNSSATYNWRKIEDGG